MIETVAPIKLACLISGGGRTLLNIADHIDRGELDAQITAVIASRTDIAGVERARNLGFDVHIADHRQMTDEEQRQLQIRAWIDQADAELICLCGWLSLLELTPEMHGRVINIHPALLPQFGGKGMYGLRVHKAVLESGARVSGCTVHFVDEQYDHGPIILQRRCPVLDDDTPETLADRVFAEECIAYPQAIQLFAEHRVHLQNDRVVIRDWGFGIGDSGFAKEPRTK